MGISRIQAVEHVHLEAPFGIEEELRWFYAEVADLAEVKRGSPDGPGLCFKSERIELRIRFADEHRNVPRAINVTILVLSLATVMEMLDERSISYELHRGTMYSDRSLEVLDPAENRVRLKRYWPIGSL